MSFPGSTLDERFIRGAIRLGAWDTGPAWNASSDYYQWLLDYLLHWPNTDASVPPKRLYCGKLEVDIIKDLATLTGLERGESPTKESDFDYLGRMLIAEDA